MNLSNAETHDLVHDSEALYKFYRTERRRAWNNFKQFDELSKDYEQRHKIKRGNDGQN